MREGVINEYAIKFVVPVPAQVHKLHFTWENLAGRPVSFNNGPLSHSSRAIRLKYCLHARARARRGGSSRIHIVGTRPMHFPLGYIERKLPG